MSGLVFDFHVHPLPTLEENALLRELDKAGVGRCVLLAMDVDPQDLDRSIGRFVDFGVWDLRALDGARELLRLARTPNERVAELVKAHPNRFVGFGSVNPSRSRGEVQARLEQIKRLRLRGIKLIPTLQMFSPKREAKKLADIFEFCRSEGFIILYHTGCDPGPWEIPCLSEDANPAHLEFMLRRFRDVPVVLAHMGSYSARHPGIWLEEALKLGRRYGNVWFDIAAVTYLVNEGRYLEEIRRAVGLDRVLFGSDYPAVQGSSISDAVDDVLNSPLLTWEEKAGILHLNAERLLGG